MPLPLIALPLLSLAMTSLEADPSSARDALATCLTELNDMTRLACLERAARALIADPAPPANGDASLPSRRTKRTEPTKFEGLDSAVISVAEANVPGRFIFVARDGSRWRTEETGLGAPPRLGQHLVIKRAALGSYRVTFDGERPVQVSRLTR